MITVAYDHQIFSLQRFGGISRYICEIAAGVAAQENWTSRVVAPLHCNEHLARTSAPKFGVKLPIGKLIRPGRMLYAFNMLAESFSSLTRADRADLIHSTYYHPPLRRRRERLVVTVHDMIHELFPSNFGPHNRTTKHKLRSVNEADKVICVSQSTANDLQRFFQVPSAKIAITHLGISDSFASDAQFPTEPLDAQRPYLLYVGERRGYKNFIRLLEAFGACSRLREEFDLIAFGSEPFSNEELEIARRMQFRSGSLIHQTGDDRALAIAYSRARLFVYPSQYEGFGMPPLEAMSCKCPVVCSNSSSIPEVVGNAGIYFDPLDVESIRQAIEDAAFNDTLLSANREAGQLRSISFSWQRCVQETLAVYRGVLQNQ